eukprot:Seg1782.13 transcript_id=Seg1782.13/GoldUCD/mRNA.D3Y31 product="Transient receptor potential cation channel subfamily V member 1" protein_id=Seg1782.13/GoldUCD/D3Y31
MADADVKCMQKEMPAQTDEEDEQLLEDIKVPKDEAGKNEEEITKILELLDPSGQPEFWKDVREKTRDAKSDNRNASHEQMTDEVRADNITTYFQSLDKDPVVGMMTDWYDTYEAFVGDTDLYLGFEKQITKLAKIIINREYEDFREKNAALPVIQRTGRCKYSTEFSMGKGENRTVLQLCAEGFKERNIAKRDRIEKNALKKSYKRDFTAIAHCILGNDPGTQNMGNPTPLELALTHRDDNMAALLIEKTRLKSRVRSLFETHGNEKQKFRFKDIIDDPSMKKTVISVLDCTVSKDWSLVREDRKNPDGDDRFHIIADDPLRYHFSYQILDGDQEGRPARLPRKRIGDTRPAQALVERNEYFENDRFQLSISCLQALCQSQHKNAVSHPTVRSLARRKWDLYGRWRIRLYAFNYAVFLVLLTLALSLAVISKNPKRYPGKADKFRAFCELLTILVNCIYLGLEIDQLLKEGCCLYVKDYFNWVDVFGIFGILWIIPLRFASKRSQWIVAALAYIFNFLRIYKYLPAWKSICVYSRTLAIMIKKDLKVFATVYVIVLMTFCGATFLSLRGLAVYDENSGFKGVAVSGFGDIFLRGIRALTQSEGFTSEYGAYNVFSVMIILASMFVIMIFLVNILIAQLNASYERSAKEATEEYDIAKALFVARLDNSRFRFWNPRIRYYRQGSYEYNKATIKELISKWNLLHKDNQMGESSEKRDDND